MKHVIGQWIWVPYYDTGQPVPEYEKNGDCFVECKLDTPYSYKENVVEDVKGENETQVRGYLVRIGDI